MVLHHTQQKKAENLRAIRIMINKSEEIDPMMLRKELFNYRSLPPASTDKYLRELESMGELIFMVNGKGEDIIKSTRKGNDTRA